MSGSVIKASKLSKRYGQVFAVDELTIEVERGEIYGFLGLNGAGKSTTIRMLLGMAKPTAGEVFLFGSRVERDDGPWAQVGYLVDAAHAYPDLSVRDNLEIARRLHDVDDPRAVARSLDLLGLAAYADRRAGTLSSGNLQRLGLAKALIHEPDLLILDEPANALDPAAIVELRELLRRLAHDRGVTVFVSSHILAEVARLATRIGIMDRGRLLVELDADGLERRSRPRLIVDATDPEAAQRVLEMDGYRVNQAADGTLGLDDDRAMDHPDLVATALVAAGTPPTSLHLQHEDLEAFFLRLISEHKEIAA